jgi:hypothetical protein
MSTAESGNARADPGAPTADVDASVVQVYEALKALLARDNLAPATRANLVDALASVSLVVHDLNLGYEMLYDLGV